MTNKNYNNNNNNNNNNKNNDNNNNNNNNNNNKNNDNNNKGRRCKHVLFGQNRLYHEKGLFCTLRLNEKIGSVELVCGNKDTFVPTAPAQITITDCGDYFLRIVNNCGFIDMNAKAFGTPCLFQPGNWSFYEEMEFKGKKIIAARKIIRSFSIAAIFARIDDNWYRVADFCVKENGELVCEHHGMDIDIFNLDKC